MSIGNVTENMLEMIGKKYTLREQSAGEFALLKVKGMNFSIKRYLAEGLGNVSLMEAKGFFGLMKMDTLIGNGFCLTADHLRTSSKRHWEKKRRLIYFVKYCLEQENCNMTMKEWCCIMICRMKRFCF